MKFAHWRTLQHHFAMADASNHFPATRWTLLQALREGTEKDAQDALEHLCRAYWTPLYIVARRNGLREPDAEDAVQGFFESLLAQESLLKADQSLGKLRTYLLTCFEHYRSKSRRQQMALKRGGRCEIIPYSDQVDAEERYLQIAAEGVDVETLYNREWARQLLARSLEALRQAQKRRGQEERFDHLVSHITQARGEDVQMVSAEKAGMNHTAFRTAVFRLRRSYREHIEDELAVTLGTRDPEVIRHEMRELFNAFA
jgi:DNA-directed RNA polymerase specialized sigma24 family protein